jgi:hypothetical protein
MQVYLPDDLYEQVKARRLPTSQLLREAVRAEVRRQDLLSEAGAYLSGLLAEVGEPSPQERARAEAIARRIGNTRLEVVWHLSPQSDAGGPLNLGVNGSTQRSL